MFRPMLHYISIGRVSSSLSMTLNMKIRVVGLSLTESCPAFVHPLNLSCTALVREDFICLIKGGQSTSDMIVPKCRVPISFDS